MREFLDYLIRQSLSNDSPRLKEFCIAVEVFGRDESFDSRVDAIVRVEAIRLRAKLREYYSEVGPCDPVRISIPKGGYIPRYELLGDSPEPALPAPGATPGRIRWSRALFVAGTCIVFAALSWRHAVPEGERESAAEGPGTHSIAVLPLKDRNGGPEDFFSEALTDVLIAKLSGRQAFRVTALGSAMKYKDSDLPPSVIAAELGVQSIVDGAVYRDSGEVRITAHLIDAGENRNVWSQTYSRPLMGVLSLQDEIATAISEQLAGELLSVGREFEADVDPLAYEAYLKGIYWRNRLTQQGLNQAISFFRRAIDLQADYAAAYASMAAAHCRLAGHGIEAVEPGVALPHAKRLAMRALELDDSLAEANAVMGMISFKYDWDIDAAKDFLDRALSKNPSLFEGYLWLSQIAEAVGNQELAVAQARSARQINPLSPVANLNLGWQLFQAGRFDEAEGIFDEIVQFEPDFWGGHWGKGFSYRNREMYAEAIAEFSRAVELDGGHTMALASLGYTYAVAGESEEALSVIERLHEIAGDAYVSPIDVATVYAGLNDRENAFAWLSKAYAVRARSMAWLTARSEFDDFREDPRYDALVSSVGIATDRLNREFLAASMSAAIHGARVPGSRTELDSTGIRNFN